jgi:hypothetical protein
LVPNSLYILKIGDSIINVCRAIVMYVAVTPLKNVNGIEKINKEN